jgi:hypothetical protein
VEVNIMKISSLSTCMLIASAATSKNQAEAGLPSGRFIAPVARGLATGAISTGIKNIVSGLQRELNENVCVESFDFNSSGASQNNTQRSPSVVVKKSVRNFRLNFASNAMASACVDKLLGATTNEVMKNMQKLALPIACMGVTQEVLGNVSIPPQLRDTISYCAFFAVSAAQSKAPVSTGLGITGFLAGASLVKHVGCNRGASANQGVSASAASGFMDPGSGKTIGNATANSDDDYIRLRYGLKPGEKFWAGPDGSIFVPVTTTGTVQ